jgi:photosystem II stability/assembly factor-like uncharacterized protein
LETGGAIAYDYGMRKFLVAQALFLGIVAHAGSFRWTQIGPEGGIAGRLFFSPQRKELWALAQGLLFRNDPVTGIWRFVPLDNAADFANDLAFDLSDDQRLYIATSLGRVLRSSDRGANFDVSDQFLVPGVEASSVAVDPHDPNVVLAGVLADGLGGVFRSVNRGKTWSRAGLEGTATGFLFIDPHHVGTVYATSGGRDGGKVYVSTDDGLSFAFLGINGAEGDPRDMDFGDTSVRKNAFYAAVRDGVRKSVDGGRRWFNTDLTFPNGSPIGALGILRTDGLILAATVSGLYSSADGGNTWNLRGEPQSRIFSQGMFDLVFANDALFVGTRRSGIVRSVDLGASYEDYNRGFLGQRLNSLDVDPVRGNILVGSAGGSGLYRRDGRDQVTLWKRLGATLQNDNPDMFGVQDKKNPNKLYVGIRTIGAFGLRSSVDGGATWNDLTLNLAGTVPRLLALHPAREGPDHLIAATSSGVARFRQDISAWVSIFPAVPGFPRVIAFDPKRPNRIFLGTTSGLFRSDDEGDAYVDLAGPIRDVCRRSPQTFPQLCVGDPNTLPVDVLDVALDPSNGDRVFAAISLGGVWVSQQGGDRLAFYFSLQNGPGGPILDDVTSIAVHPTRPQEQYFGTTVNGVLRTRGDGHIEVFNESLRYPRIEELAFDQLTPPTLYARLLATGVVAYTFGTVDEPATFVPSLGSAGLILASLLLLAAGAVRRRRAQCLTTSGSQTTLQVNWLSLKDAPD